MMIIGGVFGMILGLEVFDELLDPPTKKLGFVSIWFSFAFALFLLNRQHKRKTFDTIQNCGWWETLLLILTGKLLLRIIIDRVLVVSEIHSTSYQCTNFSFQAL